jgi:hypothetical protein
MASSESPFLDKLRAAVQLACQPSYVPRIVQGREHVMGMPRAWVLEHITCIADQALDLNDEWEYRRLLELLDSLEPGLAQRFVLHGLSSPHPEIREAAGDFRKDCRIAH